MGEQEEVVLSEAARLLGFSHVTAWRHVQAGNLKARRVGPIYLVKRADLEAFEANRKEAGRPKGAKNRRPRPGGGQA